MKRIVFIVLGLSIAIGCTKPKDVETKIEAVSVITAKPFISSVVLTTTLQGTIMPIREAKICAKTGGKIVQILADENDCVSAGQTVAKLDQTDTSIGLIQAEAARCTSNAGLKSAEVNFENAKQEFERAQRLKEAASIAQAAFDRANTAYRAASAQLDLSRAQLNQAEVAVTAASQRLKDTIVTSPISGIITAKHLNQGEMAGQEEILTVMDISTVKVEISASEDLITKIKRDQMVRVNIDAYPEKRFTGTIYDISPTINPQSRTFKVAIRIGNPQHLIKPGMFVRCELEVEKHSHSLCVPQGAVFNRGLNNYLYVVEKDHARLKQVEPGIQDLEKIEIAKGLSAGEEVVIRGVEGLQDGALVQVARREKKESVSKNN